MFLYSGEDEEWAPEIKTRKQLFSRTEEHGESSPSTWPSVYFSTSYFWLMLIIHLFYLALLNAQLILFLSLKKKKRKKKSSS